MTIKNQGTVRRWLVPVLLVAVACAAGVSAAQAQPGFTERTAEAGLTFVYGPPADTPGLPMHGGGVAEDFNNDGWPDLYVVGGGLTRDRLFINNKNGTFTDRAAAAGLTMLYRGNGANAGDFDNDGDMDIFVTNFGDMPAPPTNGQHKLWRNNGDGTFTDVAAQVGVNSTGNYPDGYGVAWGDYDLDGDLDLWVGAWHDDGNGFSANNKLFRNNLAETGTANFTDVTAQLALFITNTQGFGAIFADMDGDRYPELMVSGDFGTSKYYKNNRDGTFTLWPILHQGDTKVHNGMGTTVGDFNRDGKLDWFVTAIYPAWENAGPPGNRLYMNLGGDEFQSLPEAAGVNDGGWGWGTSVIDFDHDGWQDIVMTNGWVNCPDPITGECFVNEPSYLFQNNHDDTFTEVGQFYGLVNTYQGRGLVTFDPDRDGDMDVVIFSNPMEGPGEDPGTGNLRFYRNNICRPGKGCTPGANFVEVRLDSHANPALPPNGWGANVKVTAGGETQIFRINGGSNYLSRSQLVAHFGLAAAQVIDEMEVEWPDGFRTVRHNVPVNQLLNVSAKVPFSHDPLVRGQQADLRVEGLRPGEVAVFLFGTSGLGQGPCFPALGGLCSDVVAAKKLGTATANTDGLAVLTTTLPPGTPDTLYLQAVTQRGDGGIASLKTNATASPVSN